MDIEAWARKNKKHIAREFVKKAGFVPSEKPSAIFTAGLPGAGKTEFTIELLKSIQDHTLRLDMDEIAKLIEGYKPKIADRFRAGASIILDKIYDEVLKARFDFVMDGTFAHDKAIANVTRAISKGYIVKVYYIHQVPNIAWKFTKDRELVEHRAINGTGFVDTYQRIQKRLNELQNPQYNVTISLVIKDEKNHVGKIIENVGNIFEHVTFITDKEIEAATMEIQ
ncbi:hypothetical protein A3D14_02700 [Candidatus Saccharibacteria bacterium RIFCSPHIGHO2_02_FULL_47_12]|nr:MAG: hypothetical protein A3D14_02700 [Candidatus Saccharibacteria bacterium RIFCSPHIGHO2_02_FULL_47_12]